MRLIKKVVKPFITRPAVARKVCRLFLLADNYIDEFLNELVMYSESGVHPKHRLMDYHQFFLDHISANDRVLDIGCGHGVVAFDLAKKAKSVLGIDMEAKKIRWAEKHYRRPNLRFLTGDATKNVPVDQCDVIILSNVLEHIEDRHTFLKAIFPLADKFLIRVPMIDRDWVVLYKKEVGIDYRLDKTHFVEYTEGQLVDELSAAGLNLEHLTVRFGEFWCVAKKKS